MVGDLIATVANGTITGATYSWVTPGAPFNLTFDTTPPTAPTGCTALGANMMASLIGQITRDSDLAGYNVYRRTNTVGYA